VTCRNCTDRDKCYSDLLQFVAQFSTELNTWSSISELRYNDHITECVRPRFTGSFCTLFECCTLPYAVTLFNSLRREICEKERDSRPCVLWKWWDVKGWKSKTGQFYNCSCRIPRQLHKLLRFMFGNFDQTHAYRCVYVTAWLTCVNVYIYKITYFYIYIHIHTYKQISWYTVHICTHFRSFDIVTFNEEM
jgi:hypothetical protein